VRKTAVVGGVKKNFSRSCEKNVTSAKDVARQIDRLIDEARSGGKLAPNHALAPGVRRHTFGELADYCEREVYVQEIIVNGVVVQKGYANVTTPKCFIGRKFFDNPKDAHPPDSASWRVLIGENTYLDQITTKWLETLRRDLFMVHFAYRDTAHQRQRSLCDVNHRLKTLRRMFSAAIEMGWMSSNPASGLVDRKGEEPRNEILSYEEEVALLKACEGDARREHLRLIILGLLETCMRTTELFKLKVRAWKQRVLRVERMTSKVRRERSIGVTDELAKEIDAWIKRHNLRDDDFMFPLKAIRIADNRERGPKYYDNERLQSPRRAWGTAKRLAGVEKITLKDLRRTGATRLYYDAGVELLDISRLLGHKSIEMTKQYIGLDNEVDAQRQRAHAEKVQAAKKKALRAARKQKLTLVK
jgi:integrase